MRRHARAAQERSRQRDDTEALAGTPGGGMVTAGAERPRQGRGAEAHTPVVNRNRLHSATAIRLAVSVALGAL